MVTTIDFELSNEEINDYVRIMLAQKAKDGVGLQLLTDFTEIHRYCNNCKSELTELFYFFSSWGSHVYCRKCIIDSGWYVRPPSSVH